MKRQKILFFTGLLLVIVPLLGFPLWFRNIVMIMTGLFLCVLSYRERGAVPFFNRRNNETFDTPSVPKDTEVSAHIISLENEQK